jgi:hypothetical protein
MPIKLNADIDGSHPLVPIVLSEIKKMTDRYRSTMPAGDTKSLWVSQAEIDALIKDNPGANGIRLYYGRHAPDDTSDLKSKHNMILVATKGPNVVGAPLSSENSVDQLNDAIENGPVNSVIVGFSGMGDDAIPLCPPHCPNPPSVLS